MDPGRFYGHNRHTNAFPENGFSDDNLAPDSDSETFAASILFRRPITIPETEFSDEDDVPLASLPSTSKGKKNRCCKEPAVRDTCQNGRKIDKFVMFVQ